MFQLKRENPKTIYGTIRPLICYTLAQSCLIWLSKEVSDRLIH